MIARRVQPRAAGRDRIPFGPLQRLLEPPGHRQTVADSIFDTIPTPTPIHAVLFSFRLQLPSAMLPASHPGD